MTITWGNQIGLRPFVDPVTDAEIERIYRWSNDAQVLQWSGGVPTELTLKEFANRLRNDQRNPSGFRLAYFIVLRSGDIIGRVGCFAIDWDKRTGELGIAIGEPIQWGRGYGRQAIDLMLRDIFQTTSLEKISLFTFPENIRAQKCFAACGFRQIATARRFSPDIGEFDGVEMEITRREWLAAYHSIQIQLSQVQNERT